MGPRTGHADSSVEHDDADAVSPAEAARRLGAGRARIDALVEQGALDAVGGSATRGLRISADSIGLVCTRPRRSASRSARPVPGLSWRWPVTTRPSATTSPHGGLTPIARAHVPVCCSTASPKLVPRLHNRGNPRRFAVGAETLVDVLSDARLVLAGPSVASALSWDLPDGSWPVEACGGLPGAATLTLLTELDLVSSFVGARCQVPNVGVIMCLT